MAAMVGSGATAARADWRTALGKSAQEVFAMMVGVSVETNDGPPIGTKARITGTVGIAGHISAVFIMQCTPETANSIASQMLGIPIEQAASNSSDAVGEMCNMIAGDFKARIGFGDTCMLSVPTVIAGADYTLLSPARSERLELGLAYGDARIEIGLDIRS